MLVRYNNVWLTNDGSGTFSGRAITSTSEGRLNGKQLIQEAAFLRGISGIPIPRGNLTHSFNFKVYRNFQLLNPAASNPVALAEIFMLTHFTQLPKSGVLQVYCGGLEVNCTAAAIEGAEHSYAGVGVETTYSFRCGAFTAIQNELVTDDSIPLKTDDGATLSP